MFRKMPLILLAILLLVKGVGHWMPLPLQAALYGISLSIKSLIVFTLPLIVFGLLFKTSVRFAGQASKMIFFILLMVCTSNFLSTLFSYSVGTLIYHFDLSMGFPEEGGSLMPLWELAFPKWIDNDKAMFAGLLSGIVLGRFAPALANSIASPLDKLVNLALKAIFFAIPVFIAGFIVKMNHDQVIGNIMRHYSLVFILIASALVCYISLIYFVFSSLQLRNAVESLRNMLPAALAGFGSMSSAAAMPLTILGAEKNAKNSDLARSLIPITVNIHLIGDCFAIPIFAFAVMKSFGVAEPGFLSYLLFASYFVMAKFSVAAVPGGGILVMLPILEAYLGFNAEMLSLITALYILFDPVITCANVLGNGGFALAVEKMILGGKKVFRMQRNIEEF